jgi:hypothetical protein
MTNSYDEAKAQRNILERLGDKIPGYRGFQDRELRRDVDRLLREHLASELGRLKSALRDRTRSYTDAGKIGALNGFDRLDRQIDGLSQAVRFADYGATGLFDPVKIGEDDLAQLEAGVAAVPAPGADDPAPALDRLQQAVRALDDKWKQRKQVIGNAVQSGQSA